jgi:hypothetical protein
VDRAREGIDPVPNKREAHTMGLYYQTEYRLGRRRGTVRRTYTGATAFLAIAIDLFFVMTFELVFALTFFVLRNVWILLTAVFYVLSVPFIIAKWVSRKIEQRFPSYASAGRSRAPFKPAWASFDEV